MVFNNLKNAKFRVTQRLILINNLKGKYGIRRNEQIFVKIKL